jgi:hypothetical protein
MKTPESIDNTPEIMDEVVDQLLFLQSKFETAVIAERHAKANLSEIREKLVALEKSYETLSAEIKLKDQHITNIQNSISWKITAPIRFLVGPLMLIR